MQHNSSGEGGGRGGFFSSAMSLFTMDAPACCGPVKEYNNHFRPKNDQELISHYKIHSLPKGQVMRICRSSTSVYCPDVLEIHTVTHNVSPETHKELKCITPVHSVRTFSLPSTIFGNTKNLYMNDLHT